MASPYVRVDAYGRILGSTEAEKSNGAIYDNLNLAALLQAPAELADEATRAVPVGGSVSGTIDFEGDVDVLTVNLTAGQTYTFSLRGTGAAPLSDSLLLLATASGSVIAADDDGGNDLYSLLTFTATESGTYLLAARSFANAGDPGLGGYTVDVRAQPATDSVGHTNATAQAIEQGTTFGFRDAAVDSPVISPALAGDVDRYAVTLEAGQYYTFKLAGGADYATDPAAVPAGELDTVLILRDAEGNILSLNDDNNYPSDISSSLGFFATESGTYYLDAAAYAGQTGGYALEFNQVDISSLDPIDAFNWESANNVPFVDVNGTPTAYVYFAEAGESFGELADDGVAPLPSFGWNDFEKQQVMLALEEYEHILGVDYQITTDVEQATFRLITTESEQYGAYFYPQDPAYGSQQGIGAFNIRSGGWTLPGQESLDRGGFAFAVILHEFGHAHGLAHPHDRGGGSDVLLGVTGSASLGVFDLNQGVYTVMSYNDAWVTHPDGPSPYTRSTIGYGWSATLSAFDIATLQQRYGVHDYATGDDVYRLGDANESGTFYQTIWDTGGTDSIDYGGARDARIDLLAATLDYSATGGGVVSFVDDVYGGYAIANGVVIENASGGSGDDIILGNAAANALLGNDGADTLLGREGDDLLVGGAGQDVLDGGDGLDVLRLGAGADTVLVSLGDTRTQLKGGAMSVDIVTDFERGEDVIDLAGLGQSFTFQGKRANGEAGALTYKSYGNVNAAEKVLGIDLDGRPGANGASGPVTVVYGNMDGGKADFAIVLLGVKDVAAADFALVTAPAAMAGSLIQPDYFQL